MKGLTIELRRSLWMVCLPRICEDQIIGSEKPHASVRSRLVDKDLWTAGVKYPVRIHVIQQRPV